MNAEVYCDECGAQIVMNHKSFKEEKDKLDGEKVTVKFFECPNCKRRYVITVADRKTKNLIDKQTTLQIRYAMAMKRKAPQQEITKIRREFEEVKEQLKAAVKENKKRYAERRG